MYDFCNDLHSSFSIFSFILVKNLNIVHQVCISIIIMLNNYTISIPGRKCKNSIAITLVRFSPTYRYTLFRVIVFCMGGSKEQYCAISFIQHHF